MSEAPAENAVAPAADAEPAVNTEGEEAAAAAAEASEVDTSWRENVSDDLKSHAERFNSINDLVQGHVDLRKQISTSIRPLSKDATPEEVADYRTKMGIPHAPEGYLEKVPEEIKEQINGNEYYKSQVDEMLQFAHANNLPEELALGFAQLRMEQEQKTLDMEKTHDQNYADESEKTLRAKWGDDYDRNRNLVNEYVRVVYNEDETNIQELRQIQLASGRYLLDHPVMQEFMALAARRVGEDGIALNMSEDTQKSIQQRIDEIHSWQFHADQAKKDQYKTSAVQTELESLYEQLHGTEGVVDGMDRTV